MRPDDWPRVAEIYAEGIATGYATFETSVPTYEAWDAGRRKDLRYVAELDGVVAAWVAASPVSARPAYAGVVEHGIYVYPGSTGLGLGSTLLRHFIAASERAGVWTIQSGVFPENTASLALHAGCGFRQVGVRERIGRLHGRWRDVVLLERRSPVVG
jgi:phosphinothricin acetyltransferase